MPPHPYSRVEELFHAARSAAAEARTRLLDEACGNDLELRREVESLLRIDAEAPSFLDRPLVAAPNPSDGADIDVQLPYALGAYQLVRELGRGGMGRVYEAVQEDVGRRVAIKLLPPALSSAMLRSRFRSEQRILAGLEHPGIARLYDAGTTPEGVPYLVMEYIHGQDLLTYCNARQLGLHDRLRLFARVCDAVQFAHQHLVVHRDLKPSNVLVTDDGEPKLLDFGIAKLLHEDHDSGPVGLTITGQRLMTPEYASPEQVRGDRITTASDVYSLGVVLYELLTGARPYRLVSRSPHDLERSVLEQVPLRPSAVPASQKHAKALRGDLDNIVMKALAKHPAERHATADDLGSDLRLYLNGLPVSARHASVSYRTRKFITRHRWPVAASVAVTIALLAALAVAVAAAADARRERDLAARRFADVRALANVFLFDVEQQIRDIAGTTAARELLVSTGLGYLDRLAVDAGDDPELLREIAGGYERLGDLQGALLASNLGQSEAALSSYQKASALRVRLARDHGTADPIVLREGARAELRLSQALLRVGRLSEAMAHSKAALDMLSRVVVSAQDQVDVARERGEALTTHGYMVAVNGDLTGALGFYRQAIALFEGLLPERPADATMGRAYALALFRTVQTLAELPDGAGRAEAIAIAPRAIAIDRALLAADPHRADLRRGLSRDLARFAGLLSDVNRCDESLTHLAEAKRLLDEDVALDARDVLARRNRNAVASQSFKCLLTLGRAQEARAALEPALADTTALLADDPKNITLQMTFAHLATGLMRTGLVLHAGRPDAALIARARPALERAVAILTPLVANKTLTGSDAAILDDARAAMAAAETAPQDASAFPSSR